MVYFLKFSKRPWAESKSHPMDHALHINQLGIRTYLCSVLSKNELLYITKRRKYDAFTHPQEQQSKREGAKPTNIVWGRKYTFYLWIKKNTIGDLFIFFL